MFAHTVIFFKYFLMKMDDFFNRVFKMLFQQSGSFRRCRGRPRTSSMQFSKYIILNTLFRKCKSAGYRDFLVKPSGRAESFMYVRNAMAQKLFLTYIKDLTIG